MGFGLTHFIGPVVLVDVVPEDRAELFLAVKSRLIYMFGLVLHDPESWSKVAKFK